MKLSGYKARVPNGWLNNFQMQSALLQVFMKFMAAAIYAYYSGGLKQ